MTDKKQAVHKSNFEGHLIIGVMYCLFFESDALYRESAIS